MSINTGTLMPDEGKIEWAKNVRVVILTSHTVLEKGMTVREVLTSAFDFFFEMEEKMNHICDNMGEMSRMRWIQPWRNSDYSGSSHDA